MTSSWNYVRSPAMFKFLSQFISKTEKHYRSNPTLFDRNYSPMNVGIKPVRYSSPKAKPKPPCQSAAAHKNVPNRPCILCTTKGFQSDHFSLNLDCGVAKLSSPEILQHLLHQSLPNLHLRPQSCLLMRLDTPAKWCLQSLHHPPDGERSPMVILPGDSV